MKVAIIGGGMSGLLTAYRLARNCSVTVYEKQGKLGGLAGGVDDDDGTHGDKYNHCLCCADTEILRVIRELNLSHDLCWRVARQGIVQNNTVVPACRADDLLRFTSLSFTDKIRLAGFFLKNNLRGESGDLDNVPARDWVIQNCGEKVWEYFFEPSLKFKYSVPGNTISAAYLWARIHEKKHGKIAVFAHSSDGLIQGLRQAVEKDRGVFRLGTEVTGLKRQGNRWHVAGGEGETAYDCVVYTGPYSEAIALCPAIPAACPKTALPVEYLSVDCCVLRLDRPLKESYWLFMVLSKGRASRVVIDTAALCDNPLVYIPVYRPAGNKNPSQYELCLRESFEFCERINPQFKLDWVKKHYFFSDTQVEPVFSLNYVRSMRDDPEILPGLFIPELFRERSLLKTFNSAAIKSRIIAAKIQAKYAGNHSNRR
ncbi:MAG: FAD-dependent oxidoreductase [Candidatus Omnitrophica bacterium]|nr:FAD-dependent oxidoreductase [Candidatus Omnitrophota bacterium]